MFRTVLFSFGNSLFRAATVIRTQAFRPFGQQATQPTPSDRETSAEKISKVSCGSLLPNIRFPLKDKK